MRVSVLVVSRTPGLLSRMLTGLASATGLNNTELEILCSWNGSEADEQAIENHSGYELLIAQREPYHFATNMNALAGRANGELLLFMNDDVELDAGSVDAALEALQTFPNAGLIGARLRDRDGLLTHAGILFDRSHSPYHQLDRLIGSEHPAVLGTPRAMPAVTGALMLLRREHFQQLRFATDYRVCGEDVELCLDLRERFGLEVVLAPAFSGLHGGETTRSQQEGQEGNSEDLSRMRARHCRFLESASKGQLQVEWQSSVAEADILRSLEAHRRQESAQISALLAELRRRDRPAELTAEIETKQRLLVKQLREELQHWRQQSHALQLSRLKLEQELKYARRGT